MQIFCVFCLFFVPFFLSSAEVENVFPLNESFTKEEKLCECGCHCGKSCECGCKSGRECSCCSSLR